MESATNDGRPSPENLLFIMSDEHTRSVLGCYGNRSVHTPNLDRLAAGGTRFTNAYTPSPVCVSARASLATGRWVHDTGAWSSAEPYDGAVPGWGHRLIDAGHRVASVGKLHYRQTRDTNGFDEELLPLHVVGGVGWAKGLLRDPLPVYGDATRELADQVGAGETSYSHYDRRICATACDWLNRNGTERDKPWVLFVSFVSPHYPLIAPQGFYDLHDFADIGLPHRRDEEPNHPVLKEIYDFYSYRQHFTDEAVRQGRLGYYGLCALVDHLVGRLLATLDELGLGEETRILYTSDHGEMLGNHGMWTKMLMNEDSAGIPLILNGPGVPRGAVVDTPVSLVDAHQTILEGAGLALSEADRTLPGRNLMDIAAGAAPERTILSEFHDGGRRPAISWSARTTGSTSTMPGAGRSCSTWRATRWRTRTWARARPMPASARTARPCYAISSTPRRSTGAPSPRRRARSRRSAAARRSFPWKGSISASPP